MPVYRIPTIKAVINKVWFRVREFIIEAWPLLIIGSMVLAVMNYFNFSQILNVVISPITWVLGLPTETGVPLIFGILRKELSLVMLRQALGVVEFSSAMTSLQMLTFTVFVVFYIPCLPTLTALKKELGSREMLSIAGFTLIVALVASLIARGVGFLILG
jgi:ferrous iron transport protein B